MEFTSQICTTKEQSERLLALRLKRETADMCWTIRADDREGNEYPVEYMSIGQGEYQMMHPNWYIPAWSLHRLIEMMPNKIRVHGSSASLIVSNEKVQYYLHDVEYSDYLTGVGCWKSGNIYDNIIDCIEWLIGAGYFYKEYLEE